MDGVTLAELVRQVKSGSVDKIVNPHGTGGYHFNVCIRIGLCDDSHWYTDILVSQFLAT